MIMNIKSVDNMNVDELIGQVIMVGLPGLTLTKDYLEFISKYKIGNYILFARNYDNTEQMKKLMKEVYDHTLSVTGSFPLVSIDQEGGMVVRLFKDVTFPASPMTTAATLVEDAPYKTGKIIGKDMLMMGINLNLAPCLEINENLSNPLVNVRGYGGTKEIVLKNAKEFVHGLQDSGVLSCIKHFPGAGSTVTDSHLELPIIDDAKEDLMNYNIYPFINILESDAIMTSHCVYKAFDEYPSTVSKILLTDVLRNEIGFDGLVISDGMEMKAITDTYGLGEGCVMALNAGCDILLLCHEYNEQKEAFEAVKKAIENNELSIDLLRERVTRINKAKEKILQALSDNFNNDEYIINKQEHELMQKIVDNSYTLIKGTKPYINKDSLIVCAKVRVASIVEDEFDVRDLTKVLKVNFPNNTIIQFCEENKQFIENNINNYSNILVYSYDAYADDTQKEIINKLLTLNKEVHVISIKGPIDQKYFNNLVNYSCLYEYTPNSIRTIVKQLKEDLPLNGKLPM